VLVLKISMEETYKSSKKLALEARARLESAERQVCGLGSQSGAGGVAEMRALDDAINALGACAQELHLLLPKENVHRRRQYWEPRMAQLDDELRDLSVAKARLDQRVSKEKRESDMREQLFGGARTGDAAIPIGASYSYEQEASILNQSQNAVDSILESGKSALNALNIQRATLKGTKRKMLDVANNLGVSKDLIRSIERKENEVALLVYAGMAVFTLILVALFVWRKIL